MTQTLPILLLSAVVAAAAGATASYLVAPKAVDAGTGGSNASDAVLERLSNDLADMATRQSSIEASLRELGTKSELVAPSAGRVSMGDIDAAVARYMDARAPATELAAVEAEPVEQAASPDRVAAALQELGQPGLSDIDRQALWRKFSEEGLTDELVAMFESMAEQSPNDPDAQVAVAGAYLNKIFEVGNSPEAGLWATKADQAFDRALDLDDQHWDARFSKAVSLSFWPPVFGKQGEAIQQFEVLVGQQAGLPADQRYAQTHLLLGNMYQQIGQDQKAAAAWQRGLDLYPGDEELMGQLSVFSGEESSH